MNNKLTIFGTVSVILAWLNIQIILLEVIEPGQSPYARISTLGFRLKNIFSDL